MKTNYLLGCFRNSILKMTLMSLCVCTCIVVDNIDAIRYLFTGTGNISVCYYITNSLIFGGQLLPYFGAVFSSGLLAADNCKERLSGMSMYVIGRMGERRYTIGRTLYTCLGAAAISSLGMLLFVGFSSIFIPFFIPEFAPEMSGFPYCSLLISGSETGYLCIIEYLMALSGAFYGALAMACDVLFNNIYVTSASPLLASCLITRLFVMLDVPSSLRLDLWLCARTSFRSDETTLILCAVVVAFTVIICWLIYYRKTRRQIKGG